MQKTPKDILKQYWGHNTFRGSQEQIITAILNNDDVLALLPTGGGKSICYQIPALVQDGICIVISPLIALIQDQVSSLKKKGIKALALTGGISLDEVGAILDNCIFGNYKFLYLSPERLQQDIVKERIQQMNVNLIAIDEAHCISQWGNDFRPAYSNCSVLRDILPNTPIIAVTATATKKVAIDIVENLQFKNKLIVKDSFSRDNICFKVLWNEDKIYQLKQLCSQTNEGIIIYVRSRRLCEQISNYLNNNGFENTFFHGGISKKEKETRLTNWINNTVKIIVATNAFGMGIDKPDVRLVVHYQIPDSLENYFQEAGRAGRDGKKSNAILLLNNEDETQVKQQFLSVLPNVDFLKLIYKKLNNYFQISYGEVSDEKYYLNFNKFCSAYKLNKMLAYNALHILDQYSVVSMSKNYTKQATVKFIAPKQQLNNYLATHTDLAAVTQILLRTYGGIFEHAIKINPFLIAKKGSISEKIVGYVLDKLQKDDIVEYTAQHNDIELFFLVPREDELTINAFSKKVKEQQQVKINNIDSILFYIKNNTVCRNTLLLKYFGEQKKECGKCDVCIKNKGTDTTVLDIAIQEIYLLLKKSNLNSRSIIKKVPYKEAIVLEALQQLLEDNKITVNTTNQYQIQ